MCRDTRNHARSAHMYSSSSVVKYIYPCCALQGHARIITNALTDTHTHTHTLQHTHAHGPVPHNAYMPAYTYTHRIVQSRVAPFVLGVEITARSDQKFTNLVQTLPKCVRTLVSEKRTPSVGTHFYTHLFTQTVQALSE